MHSTVIRRAAAGGVLASVMVAAAGAAAPDLRLVSAAARQDAGAVRALLAAGVDVGARRADGVTALLWAAHWDDVATAELLLAAGADPNAADDHGVTPPTEGPNRGAYPNGYIVIYWFRVVQDGATFRAVATAPSPAVLAPGRFIRILGEGDDFD